MKSEKGLTLIELIVAAALVSVVMLGILNVQYYMVKNTSVNQAKEMISYDSVLIKRYLTSDIRNSAAPNSKTSPVNVLDNGMGLLIYTKKENVYSQIFYRISPTDNKILQRAYLVLPAGSPDPDVIMPSYGIISEGLGYESAGEGVWHNLTNLLDENQGEIFSSAESSFESIKGINFSFTLTSPNEHINPVEIKDTVYSRNPQY